MANVLRVLIVEDDDNDRHMMVLALQEGDYDIYHECVSSAATLREALHRGYWDVVLSDYSMPGFGGDEALRIVLESGLSAPFILVSGTIGEDAAVRMIKSGANEYVSKDSLGKLLPTLKRALSEMEARFRANFDQAAIGMAHIGIDGWILRTNKKFREILGHSSVDELLPCRGDDIFLDETEEGAQLQRDLEQGIRANYTTERRFVNKGGACGWLKVDASMVRDSKGERSYILQVIEDISERKRAAEELARTNRELQEAHEKLSKSFATSITMFSNLIGLRQGTTAGNSRRIVDLARRIAKQLRMDGAALHDITVAALLRDIGMLTLPERLVGKAIAAMSGEERLQFVMNPIKGQALLMGLERLSGAGRLIRSQHERWDGTGYPDSIGGAQIPAGARIIAVARDYEGLQSGLVTNMRLTPSQAKDFIVADRGGRYDPEVVDAFSQVVGLASIQGEPSAEKHLTTAQVRSGMVLSRDLLTRDGQVLLSRDHVLDPSLIGMIQGYENMDGSPLDIRVRIAASLV